MNDNLYLLAVLLLAAGVTFLIRVVPLLLGSRFVQSHPWIRSLGDFLPLSVMVILVLAGLMDAASQRMDLGFAGLVSIVVVVLVQWVRRSPLLSILPERLCMWRMQTALSRPFFRKPEAVRLK